MGISISSMGFPLESRFRPSIALILGFQVGSKLLSNYKPLPKPYDLNLMPLFGLGRKTSRFASFSNLFPTACTIHRGGFVLVVLRSRYNSTTTLVPGWKVGKACRTRCTRLFRWVFGVLFEMEDTFEARSYHKACVHTRLQVFVLRGR